MDAKKTVMVCVFMAAIAAALFYNQPASKTDGVEDLITALPPQAEVQSSESKQSASVSSLAGEQQQQQQQQMSAENSCEAEPYYSVNDEGATVMVMQCTKPQLQKTHSYDAYSNAALANLAYGDADAAEVLGMRLREQNKKVALSLIIRSSALSAGSTEVLKRYANSYPVPAFVDGEPVLDSIHTRYVLSAVAELLGDTNVGLDVWEQTVRETSLAPEVTIAFLRGKARDIVDEMRRIEQEVVGHTTIAGDDDA